ncbi:nitroreductase family protein [Micromonospora sp. NPDC049679]|uniref:nitroreductase family protein n=1 Tax=Micromonospora sp. NPDC049679 TaxID=3155920 RepID=UPI0033DBA213
MAELHPLLAERWSPRAFDPYARVSDADLTSLLEAARWAPSAANTQPWRFVVGRRDDETHKRIFVNLSPGNQRWAGSAALLVMGAHATASRTGAPLTHAAYDLGQAVAHFSLQAAALGLHVHQMAGFDAAGLRSDLELPDAVNPHVVAAVGRLGDPAFLPEDLRLRETGLRRRHPLTDLLLN